MRTHVARHRLVFGGQRDEQGSDGVLGTLDWRVGEHAWLDLGIESRAIDIPFTLTGPLGGTLQRTASVSVHSYSFAARAGVAPRWNLYLHASSHDYERDLRVLPRIDLEVTIGSARSELFGSGLYGG